MTADDDSRIIAAKTACDYRLAFFFYDYVLPTHDALLVYYIFLYRSRDQITTTTTDATNEFRGVRVSRFELL